MKLAQSADASVRGGATSVALYTALAMCVVSQAYLAWTFGALTGPHRSSWAVAMALVLSLGLPTAMLIAACYVSKSTDMPQKTLLVMALAGLMMRLPYFGVGPMLEDDHFRYMLDGALTAHGLDPYAVAPTALTDGSATSARLAVAAAGRDAISQINFPELRTIYPGTAQLLFALAHLIKPWSIDGLRIVTLLCETITALLCWRLLGTVSRPRHLVALVWCNPLMAFTLVGQAHIDAALGPLLLAAVIATLRISGGVAGAAVGLAIGVKLWPVMLAPILLRRLGERRAQIVFLAAMAITSMALCAPLLVASLTAHSGLVAYARGWHMNNMPYEWASYAGYLLVGGDGLERLLRAAVVAACAGIGFALALRPFSDESLEAERDLVARLAGMAAFVFYLSPAQFPWYAFWFLPLAVLAGNWALVVATAALPSYFLFFPLAGSGTGDLYRYWLSGLHLLPVVVVLVLQHYSWRSDKQ